jgi:transcriptional regulator with XRE-family HTH domain
MSISDQIAQRIKLERKLRGFSLDKLAQRSGVSRAMISKIERQASTPTAVLLARLAEALGMTMTALMSERNTVAHGITRLKQQNQWIDPETGYSRRIVSAAQNEGDAEIVAIELPANAQISFAANHAVQIEAKLVLMEGQLQVATENEQWQLYAGDCVRFSVHVAHSIHNLRPYPARYIVVMRHTQLALQSNP